MAVSFEQMTLSFMEVTRLLEMNDFPANEIVGWAFQFAILGQMFTVENGAVTGINEAAVGGIQGLTAEQMNQVPQIQQIIAAMKQMQG